MSRNEETFRNELNHAIDFDRVLEQIASFASFSLSKEKIVSAIPYFDRLEIQRELEYVQEGMELVRLQCDIPMGGCTDVSMPVKKAVKKMTLSPKELLDVLSFLICVRQVKSALEKTETILLKDLGASMDIPSMLIKQIQSQIDMTGSVKDDATETLRKKHKALTETRLHLNDIARNFLKRNKNMLMENMTTTIQGRLSVLVRVQDKNAFGGMIHGQSQSGQAFYVEPQAFVEANNQIQLLQVEIEEEKHRICKELSLKVASNEVAILSDLETITILDVAMTKARWAYRYDGCIPTLQTRDHSFRLEYARHPLLDEKKVVANTYILKSNEACLMISGPNMGGKTVTLKTIGLFVALSHAGFPVLCHRAILPFYKSIWFDIGDNQSIEENLSTFSSHISSIAGICRNCDEHAFVLLDEIGNGTDPLEGASLATAILEYLIDKKCTIVTSTHYNQVKTFGKTNPNVLVSSVEFDANTLKPTYRYIPGVSGASYAFSIAKEYELNDDILEKAIQYKNENEQNIEKELQRLEVLQTQVYKEKERFNALIEKAHTIQKDAEKEKEKWELKNKELQEEYEQQLKNMLEEKEAEAKEIIQELKSKNVVKPHEQSEALHQIHSMQKETIKEEKESNYILKAGDYVQIEDLQTHGEILEIKKKEATILANGMKMKIKLNRLKPIAKPNVQKTVQKKHIDRVFARFPLEINLIGMRVEEGLDALNNYLDQAVYHKVKQVRVIHGVGTGALRAAIWKDLDRHPMVSAKMAASPGEGGLGATIVLLK
ncbi:MAG: Smr/MutS family protein [Holdemanella sp.]|nr:Smr/MutS family protein [Holdemanella sp.]